MILFSSKSSWILMIIAITFDFAVPYILSLFYPGYSHMKQVMSVLGNPKSPVAIFYNIWLVILGILICISAATFYNTYSMVSRGYAISAAVILIIFGVGAGILSGIFSVGESKAIETVSSKIHGIGAGIGFMLLTFIPLIVGVLSFKGGDSIIGTISIIFFVLSIVLFALFIMSEKESFQNSIIGFSGLWQRLLLASMYMPLLIIALKHTIIKT